MLIFSVICPSSYDNISKKWIQEIRHYSPSTPIVIVGTKVDARDDKNIIDSLRRKNASTIMYEQGLELAKSFGCKYVECSALTQKGLKNAFDEVLRAVCGINREKKKKKKLARCNIM